MKTNFKISGIENDYNHLFDLSSKELGQQGAAKLVVDKKPGYPCRLSLQDAEVGEEVILLPYMHHKTESPYQATGPIFVRNNVERANLPVNEIPQMLIHRLLSLRIYDKTGMMIDAKTIEGKDLRKEIDIIFDNEHSKYIHVHNSGPGCYNCQIDRIK